MKYVSAYYVKIGVTETVAKAALKARIETIKCEALEDGFEIDYSKACDEAASRVGVIRSFEYMQVGSTIFDKLMEDIKTGL